MAVAVAVAVAVAAAASIVRSRSGNFLCLNLFHCHYGRYSSVGTIFFFMSQTVCMKYAVIDSSLEFAGTLTKVKVFGNVIRIFVPTLSVE